MKPINHLNPHRIEEFSYLSDDLVKIVVEKKSVTFTPGSAINLSIDGIHSQAYAIASAPNQTDLTFYLRLIPGGLISQQIKHLKQTQEIYLGQSFKCLDFNAQPAIFLATGTGITPFLSYLHQDLKSEQMPLTIWYGVKNKKSAIELDFLQQFPQFRLFTSEATPDHAPSGRMTAFLETLPNIPDAHYYLCGLGEMVHEISLFLEQERQVDYFTHIHSSVFYFQNQI